MRSKGFEVPIQTIFSLLVWSWRNWNFRPVCEDLLWKRRVERFAGELIFWIQEARTAETDGSH